MSIALFPPENESAVNKRQPSLYARHQIHRGRKEPSVQSLKSSLEVYFRQVWHSNQRYPASAVRFLARFSQCPHNRLADGELMAAILTLTNTHEHHQLPRLTSRNTPSQSVHLETEINRRWKMEIETEGFGVETGTGKQDRGNKISTWERRRRSNQTKTKPNLELQAIHPHLPQCIPMHIRIQ
jgi:hypothetical protein